MRLINNINLCYTIYKSNNILFVKMPCTLVLNSKSSWCGQYYFYKFHQTIIEFIIIVHYQVSGRMGLKNDRLWYASVFCIIMFFFLKKNNIIYYIIKYVVLYELRSGTHKSAVNILETRSLVKKNKEWNSY